MKKFRLILFSLVLALLLPVLSPAALALEEPEVTAGAALLMDAGYDEVLYEKNANTRMYPASITKVMTALLVLEAVDSGLLSMDQVVTVSNTFQTGISSNAVTQAFSPGEQTTVEDLLYCLLVYSACDAANILAEEVDGTVSMFVDHMNRRARELGCENTQFVNPHGLHDDDHYTTAYDIYLFARQAMTHEEFRTIVATKSYTVPPTNKYGKREFYNRNALLVTWYQTESYIYDKCIGIKTGNTDQAGYCLVSAAVSGDDYLICVVLNAQIVQNENGSTDRRHFSESRSLLRWGFSSFNRMEIVDTSTPVGQVEVTLSESEHVLVRPGQQLERTLPSDVTLKDIQQDVHITVPTVQAPVAAGQVLGYMVLSYQGRELGQVDLVAVEDVELSEILYNLERAQDFLRTYGVAIGVGAAALVVLAVILRLTALRPRSPYSSPRSRRRPPRNYNGRR